MQNQKPAKKILSAALSVLLLCALAACGGNVQTGVDLNSLSMEEIEAKAREEGRLESVGMPGSWANWQDTWDDIEASYGIEHNDTDMSSGEEIAMFEAEQSSPTKDIGDVGHSFGEEAKLKGVTQSYRTSYWDSVPDWAKDPDGHWMMAYTGITTFLTNTDLVDEAPTSWQDVREGNYKLTIGDVADGAIGQGNVLASAYAFGGGLDDIRPAIDFWKEMAAADRIDNGDILLPRVQAGEVEVGVTWSYNALGYRDQTPEYAFHYHVPSDGAILSGYVSIINKYAPHPHAAALAREYIFSDAGQINLAKGYAIPIRRDVEIPAEIQANGIPSEQTANAIPIMDPVKYAEVREQISTAWQEEVVPLMS